MWFTNLHLTHFETLKSLRIQIYPFDIKNDNEKVTFATGYVECSVYKLRLLETSLKSF